MFFILAFLYILGSIRAAPTSTIFPRDASTLPSFADPPACMCPQNQCAATDIVWSCLATIFACAWVAVHPNIPSPATPEGGRIPEAPEVQASGVVENMGIEEPVRSMGQAHKVLSNLHPKSVIRAMHATIDQVLGWLKGLGNLIVAKWHLALPRLELMAWTIIAPEFMIFWAMRQWKGAHTLMWQFGVKGLGKMTDLYPGWTKTHGYFLQMGGFILYDGDRRLRILNAGNLCYLLEEKKIQDIKLTKEDIEDHSKGDALSKTIVLGQTTWFVAQYISRRAQNLSTTELELITLAFAVLNGFMYFFWWDKPLDVSTPGRVYLRSDLSDEGKEQLFDRLEVKNNPEANKSKTTSGPLYQWTLKAIKTMQQRLLDMSVFSERMDSERITQDARNVHIFYAESLSYKDAEQMQAIASMVAVIFGAIHCVGWNFAFPSTAESILWHVSSLIVTTAPLLMEVRFLLTVLNFDSGLAFDIFWLFIAYIALPLYFLARIVLILEAILTLHHLSPSALATVQWSSFVPHI